VPALEPIVGVRVVATAESIDDARWTPTAGTAVWRTAPDEAFAWQSDAAVTVALDDPDAIIEPERGFVVAKLSPADLEWVGRHVDFPLPTDLPALVQGKVAGVPVRLGLPAAGVGVLLVHAAYADDLRKRLGW
jgi:hypothetical protein